jgi:hypothetical protein
VRYVWNTLQVVLKISPKEILVEFSYGVVAVVVVVVHVVQQ